MNRGHKQLLGNSCIVTVKPTSITEENIEQLMNYVVRNKLSFLMPIIQTDRSSGALCLQGRKTVFGHCPATTTELLQHLTVLAAEHPTLELAVSYATNLQIGFALPEVTLLIKNGMVIDTKGLSPHIGHPAPILSTNS